MDCLYYIFIFCGVILIRSFIIFTQWNTKNYFWIFLQVKQYNLKENNTSKNWKMRKMRNFDNIFSQNDKKIVKNVSNERKNCYIS